MHAKARGDLPPFDALFVYTQTLKENLDIVPHLDRIFIVPARGRPILINGKDFMPKGENVNWRTRTPLLFPGMFLSSIRNWSGSTQQCVRDDRKNSFPCSHNVFTSVITRNVEIFEMSELESRFQPPKLLAREYGTRTVIDLR